MEIHVESVSHESIMFNASSESSKSNCNSIHQMDVLGKCFFFKSAKL